MAISSQIAQNVQILLKKTQSKLVLKMGTRSFSRTLAKGPKTTT
jgi:hypothetical protein